MPADESNTNINSFNSQLDTAAENNIDQADMNNNPYKTHPANKFLIALLILFIIALGALYFYNNTNNQPENANMEEEVEAIQPTPEPTTTPTPTPTPVNELESDPVIMNLESTNNHTELETQLESLDFDEINSELNADTY